MPLALSRQEEGSRGKGGESGEDGAVLHGDGPDLAGGGVVENADPGVTGQAKDRTLGNRAAGTVVNHETVRHLGLQRVGDVVEAVPQPEGPVLRQYT